MKKGVLIAGILAISWVIIILVAGAVHAAAANTQSTGQKILGELKNIPSDPLGNEITVPANLQIPSRILFGIKGEIPIDVLITLIMVWIVLFVVIINMLKFVPFFEKKGWTVPLASFAITTLIGLSGAIRNAAVFLIGFGNFFDFLGRWSPGAIVFAIVLTFAIFTVVSKIFAMFRAIKSDAELEKAKREGSEIGVQLGLMKSMREMFDFTKGKK